jgi:hypothetical protein
LLFLNKALEGSAQKNPPTAGKVQDANIEQLIEQAPQLRQAAFRLLGFSV